MLGKRRWKSNRRQRCWCSREWPDGRVLRSGLGGRRGSGGGASGLGVGGGGQFAVEREELGLVALDGGKESVVVSGALGEDLPQQKVDVAGSGDGQSLRGIFGGEGGVIALDGRACRRGGSRAGGNVERHVGFNFERCAEFDGGSGGACDGFGRGIRQA